MTDQLVHQPKSCCAALVERTPSSALPASQAPSVLLGIDIVVEATPVDAPERTLTLERQVVIVADDDTPLPSFADGFGRSVEVLRLIVTVLLVVMGALVPFIPIVVIVFFGVRLVRRRKQPAPTIEE